MMKYRWIFFIFINFFLLTRISIIFQTMNDSLRKKLSTIIFIVIINYKLILWAQCDPVEYDLIHSILKDYDNSIRPSLTHNSTLNVTFGLALTQLIDVVSVQHFGIFEIFLRLSINIYFIWKDERNMIITTNCWLNQVNYTYFMRLFIMVKI